jgi:hypothetical protein
LAYEKRHEEFVLFLEDVFGTTTNRQKLRDAGFNVECFAEHFQHEGKREEAVIDPRIIRYCDSKKFVLFTTDKNIRYTHVDVIKKTEIAIIATESNNRYSPTVFVDALIKAKNNVERKVKRYPRPWFAHLSIDGRIRKIETITPEMSTRRRRPTEQEPPPST